MSELTENKKKMLRELIKQLHAGEVTQNITNIKKIEGEKRLLDWKG